MDKEILDGMSREEIAENGTDVFTTPALDDLG